MLIRDLVYEIQLQQKAPFELFRMNLIVFLVVSLFMSLFSRVTLVSCRWFALELYQILYFCIQLITNNLFSYYTEYE